MVRVSKVSKSMARFIGDELGVNWDIIDIDQFTKGFKMEMEHSGSVGGDLDLIGLITLDHLREHPDYYTKLESMESGR